MSSNVVVSQKVAEKLSYCKNSPQHQLHLIRLEVPYSDGFRCSEVIEMEKTHGRHANDCTWIGYFTAVKCGCTK